MKINSYVLAKTITVSLFLATMLAISSTVLATDSGSAYRPFLPSGPPETAEAWTAIILAAPGQRACMMANPPKVIVDPSMTGRGEYNTRTGMVRLSAIDNQVLIHELAHHFDYACGGAEALLEPIRDAQNLGDVAWVGDGLPVFWPAEYFANAVLLIVGEETTHSVSSRAVAAVRDWMAGTPAIRSPLKPPI